MVACQGLAPSPDEWYPGGTLTLPLVISRLQVAHEKLIFEKAGSRLHAISDILSVHS